MPTKPKGRVSLMEYAADDPKLVAGNWIEQIPEWPEVIAAYQNGVSQTSIRRWLIDQCGYSPKEATTGRVNWLSKGHPRRNRG